MFSNKTYRWWSCFQARKMTFWDNKRVPDKLMTVRNLYKIKKIWFTYKKINRS